MNTLNALDGFLGHKLKPRVPSSSGVPAGPGSARIPARNRRRSTSPARDAPSHGRLAGKSSSSAIKREEVAVPPSVLASTLPVSHARSEVDLTERSSPTSSISALKLSFSPPIAENDRLGDIDKPSAEVQKTRLGVKRKLTPKPSPSSTSSEDGDEEDEEAEDNAFDAQISTKEWEARLSLPGGPTGNGTVAMESNNTKHQLPFSDSPAITRSVEQGRWLGSSSVAILDLWSGLWETVFGSSTKEYPTQRSRTNKERRRRRHGDRKVRAAIPDFLDQETTPEPAPVEAQKVEESGPAPAHLSDPTPDLPQPVQPSPKHKPNQPTSILLPPPILPPISSDTTAEEQPPVVTTKLLSNPLPPSLLTPSSEKRSAGPFGPGKSDTDTESLADSTKEGRSRSGSLLLRRKPAPAASKSLASGGTGTLTPRSAALTPFHLPKTLILDLDETLIHSTSRPMSMQSSGMGSGSGLVGISFAGLFPGQRRGGGGGRGEGHTVEVVLNGRSTLYHVYKRPFVDHFLKKVSSWYTLVIFTASMQEYADPVIDWLDGGRGLFAKRLYRESCSLQPSGSYIKDLSLVESDLSRVCFLDNSPVSYNWNKANALPIEGWTSDPNDEALLDMLPVLDSLRFTSDVRRVLGIRGF